MELYICPHLPNFQRIVQYAVQPSQRSRSHNFEEFLGVHDSAQGTFCLREPSCPLQESLRISIFIEPDFLQLMFPKALP